MIDFYSSCGCTKLNIHSLEDIKIVQTPSGLFKFNTTCCGDYFDLNIPEMIEKEKERVFVASVNKAKQLFEEKLSQEREMFYNELKEFDNCFNPKLDRIYIIACYGKNLLPNNKFNYVQNYNEVIEHDYNDAKKVFEWRVNYILNCGYSEIPLPEPMDQGMLLEKCFQNDNKIRHIGCWTQKYTGSKYRI